MVVAKTIGVIGISCSPRRGGNTDILVKQVMTAAGAAGAEIEFLRIADLKIAPCDACWTCAETSLCHIQDDMQDIYPKLLQADGIVIGSPVHMGYNVSGQGQVFFDRTFVFWHEKKLKNKVGACVAAANRRGSISAIKVMNSVLFNHQIIIAGFANGYGHDPGDVRKDPRALADAAALGGRLCELIRIMKGKAD